MKILPTGLPGVLIIEPRVFRDTRGYFLEAWNEWTYRIAGLDCEFVQDNFSYSVHGVLRGLHYQHPHPQGKLVSVMDGEIYDVAVDIRMDSPTFGEWVGFYLSADNSRQCYIPPGFAHGFVVTSNLARVSYKCTARYDPEHEGSVLWSDPDLAIGWPIDRPVLSAKDEVAPRLRDINGERLPRVQ